MSDNLDKKTENALEKIKQEGFVYWMTFFGIDNYRKPLKENNGYEYVLVKDGRILERFEDRW